MIFRLFEPLGRGGLVHACVLIGLLACLTGCDPNVTPPDVDFESAGASLARSEACNGAFEEGARVGSAEEPSMAPMIWSVSPYQVLLPRDGVGYLRLNVDAPHYDWLVFTDADVLVESLDGPVIAQNGTVDMCASPKLAEYGAHHHQIIDWGLRLTGEPGTRVRVYAALSATEHSEPSLAGHAGHHDGDHDADGHLH